MSLKNPDQLLKPTTSQSARMGDSERQKQSLRPLRWLELLLERNFVLAAWAIVVVIFGSLRPSTFLTLGNWAAIFGSQAVLVILTLGLILPLIAGDYDLSVGGTLTLSTMMVGVLNAEQGMNIWLVMLLALAMGAGVGAVNAGFILVFGIDPFIVTLGIGTVDLGLTLLISRSHTIAGVSPGLTAVTVSDRFLGIPLEFYYGLALCVIIWYLLNHTAIGLRLLAIGRGREVARLSGINVSRLRFWALVCSGFVAAGAGIVYAGTTGSADPSSGATYLLPAFAAAFLGATTIVPGRFNPWGSVIAAYFLITGITGLTLLGYGSYVQDLFYGGALVVAVALSQVVRRREAQQITG